MEVGTWRLDEMKGEVEKIKGWRAERGERFREEQKMR